MSLMHTLKAGEGPTLLLLHGIGGSATAWTRQINLLKGSFTCIAPDLPGYGDSAAPDQPGIHPMLDALAMLLDDTPAYVVGVSFGALLALELARRKPWLVKALVLADATLGRGYLDPVAKAQWLENRRTLAHRLHTVSEARAAEIASPSASSETIQEIAHHMRRARPEGYMNVADIIANTDARHWLNEVAAPTLVVYGTDDDVTGLDFSTTLVKALPDAQLRAIERCGHAPHIERPEVFMACVKDFFQAQEASLSQPGPCNTLFPPATGIT